MNAPVISPEAAAWLADVVVVVHVLWVAIVVLAVPAIFLGAVRGWRWVRNPWFRYGHLLMIGIVVAEAWAGLICPLTALEKALKATAGEAGYERSFIGQALHDLLFFDFPSWVFTAAYTAFGALILAVFVFVRPRPLRRRSRQGVA